VQAYRLHPWFKILHTVANRAVANVPAAAADARSIADAQFEQGALALCITKRTPGCDHQQGDSGEDPAAEFHHRLAFILAVASLQK
jgi:hypothetical protein